MKRTLSILLMLALMAAACAFAEGDQEAENYTRYFDYTPVENAPIGLVPGENHNTLVLYFSRVGNTAFPEEVDAVSYASQNVTEGEKLVGTAQMVAGWIADETGGDVFPIQTAYTYPEAFWDTVTVIEGQEKDRVHPRMAAIPEDMTGYDTVWLVTPIWAYSVCLPVRSFLESVDLSGKTVYVFTTHCGSGMSDAMEVVQALQPNADVRKGMAIASDTFDGIREQVLQFVQGIQD